MTAPSFQMPFGISFTASGGSFQPSYSTDILPHGVLTLQVTTDAPQAIRINRSPARDWRTKVQIGEIPAGTGRRSIVIPGVVVEGITFLSVDRAAPVSDGATVAVTVFTVPLK